MYQRLEKQTDEAGRKSVVSTPQYRGDVRRRGGGLLLIWGGEGSGRQALGTREKTYEINFSLPPSFRLP